MAKMRLIVVDVEGDEETLASALQGVTSALLPVLDAEAEPEPKSAALPAPDLRVQAADTLPALPPASARPSKRKAKTKVPTPAAQKPAITGNGKSRDLIIAALERRPMTSGEVIQATGLPNSAVYSMLNILRGEGLVESREGETAFKVQHLVKKA